MTEKPIILQENGPIRFRDRRVNVHRGRVAYVDESTAAELCEEYEFFAEACGAELDRGGMCERPADDCPYHGDTTDDDEDDE